VREHLIRTAAPSVFVVVEVEAPTRIVSAAPSRPELLALAAWVASRPNLAHGLGVLLLDHVFGDEDRVERWRRQLAAEPGIAHAVVELLLRDPPR
jgi:hypothetical protein